MASRSSPGPTMGSPKTPRKSARSPARSQIPSNLKHSSSRDYTSEGVRDNDIFALPSSDWQLLGFLTLLAAVVRLFRIYQPSSVVFDEVHFGGFASKYIKGKFFMDVHPPLAKMLIALAGWLAGFNGDFDFKDIGKDYMEPGVPYVAMRLLPALCGVMTIPTIFLTLKATGCRTTTAALGATLVIFENGLLTNNRLILLDSPLVTATAFTCLAWTCFTNQQELGPSKAFQPTWWFWLVSTGLCLGATASIKWVGLFTIAWVGSLTVLQMWILLGDAATVTPRLWFKHLFARAFCLIIIPLTFYLAMFAIHFVCLVNPGEGDGFMSSEFQATLNSKAMQDVPADIAFGSRISLRHHNTQGGYLHSHNHMYPEGSKQQQITLYPHKDENNIFLLENQTQPEGADGALISGPKAWDNIEPTYIQNGDTIKLYHGTTDRRVHSHDVRAPVTEADWQQEVSAYGYDGFEGDANDLFRIEIIPHLSEGEVAKTRLRTIQSKFKLVHIMSGCVLFSHKVKLPDWGFEQQEVTCAKGGTLPNSIWYIEQNDHPMLGADSEKVNYKNPGFLGLVESHAWDSRPPSWPILRRGINFWGKDHRQIYLMGNPVIWLSSTLAIVIYVAVKGLSVIRWQRGYNDYSISTFKRFDYEVGSMVLGWAFHYFPFFLMQRQLFIHHYFPALYFAIIALCQVYDFVHYRFSGIGLKQRPAIGQAVAVAFIVVSVVAFTMYAPLAYGNTWTKEQCNKVKLFETWDWDCNNFFDSYAEYSNFEPAPSGPVASSSAPVAVNVAPPPISGGAGTTPPAAPPIGAIDENGNQIIGREEKIEYRDEKGNLLDEEQVRALEGKVSFQTRFETRTRLVDEFGNEIAESVAPQHADGIDPETVAEGDGAAAAAITAEGGLPAVDVAVDVEKEVSAEAEEGSAVEARPAGESLEATA